MADKKTETKKEEREYIIPLRKEWQKKANYRRAGKAAKAVKKFIAKHMKVPERDTNKVKLDIYLNQEIWFRGRKKPPAKIKVKAVKEGEIVRVTLAEEPHHVRFLRRKQERRHKPSEQPKITAKEKKEEEKTEQGAEDAKKNEEKEKEKSVAEARQTEAKQDAKAQKHLTKVKEPGYHRTALKK